MKDPPHRNTGPSATEILFPTSAGPSDELKAIVARRAPSAEELRVEYERLRQAVAAEPEVTGHQLHLAGICLRLGRKEEAKGILVKAVEVDPRARLAAMDLLRDHVSERELARIPFARETVPFYQDAAAILEYPVRGNGLVLLLGGGLVFSALLLLSFISSIFFWIPFIACAGYFCSYMMSVIESTARGEREPPDYPEFFNFWDSFLGPLFTTLCALVIPAALPVGYAILRGIDLGLVPLIALGLVYLPMAMVAGVIFQSGLAPVNVVRVVRAIRAAGREYFLGVTAIYGMILAGWLADILARQVIHAVVAPVVAQTLSLYFCMAAMHILGRIYLNHERAIGWFQKPRPAPTPAEAPCAPAATAAPPPPARREPPAAAGTDPARARPRTP